MLDAALVVFSEVDCRGHMEEKRPKSVHDVEGYGDVENRFGRYWVIRYHGDIGSILYCSLVGEELCDSK